MNKHLMIRAVVALGITTAFYVGEARVTGVDAQTMPDVITLGKDAKLGAVTFNP